MLNPLPKELDSVRKPETANCMLNSITDTRAIIAVLLWKLGGEVRITQEELDTVAGCDIKEDGVARSHVTFKLARGTGH